MRPLYISVLIGFVSFQHLAFLYLEMFLFTKPAGLKIFRMSQEQANISASLAANQGLYNGFLAAGLAWALLHPDPMFGDQIATFFLLCVIVAALYGGYSVSSRILLIQGLPALVTLLLLRFVVGT